MIVDEAEFDAALVRHPGTGKGDGLVYRADGDPDGDEGGGGTLAGERDLSRLRFMASVGEPLNPEA
ncbi:MAG: hypothetical protein R3D65_04240 [Zhengella sp.]|uniref:hypothetical protein n=1 Tax=Zhengella sp. TaxID=2282762 RepID=UPI0035297642